MTYIISCLFITLGYFSALFAVSVVDGSGYSNVCLSAANDSTAFDNFRSHVTYRKIAENVSYDDGLKYLEIIKKEYPNLLKYVDQFRKNDAFGSPVTHNYGDVGSFSPNTLRYIKIAGDLQREFGDLSRLHIVELGGGYGGQCKILADIGGFASYTLIDLPSCNALSKKYLNLSGVSNVHFVDIDKLNSDRHFDLFISNYAFSGYDSAEQQTILNKVINSTPQGYVTYYFYDQAKPIDDIVLSLFKSGRKGHVRSENPLTDQRNVLLVWRSLEGARPTPLKGKYSLTPSTEMQHQNAVTYSFSTGRFGDDLIAYFHAKWLAWKYGLPLLYKPFPHADRLHLSDKESHLSAGFSFNNTVKVLSEDQITSESSSTLFDVAYGPDCRFEYEMHKGLGLAWVDVNWEDPTFKKEVIDSLTPKVPVPTVPLLKDRISVAVHVRRGGGFDNYAVCERLIPLKFPPDSYYIEQIQRVARFFKGQPLMVYIFTDDKNPKDIARKYDKAINDPNIKFKTGWSQKFTDGSTVWRDFYSIGKFDCLIYCTSNFSIMASILGDYALKISPTHCYFKDGHPVIDQVDFAFKAQPKLYSSELK